MVGGLGLVLGDGALQEVRGQLYSRDDDELGSQSLISCSVEAHLVPLDDVFEFSSLLLLQVR